MGKFAKSTLKVAQDAGKYGASTHNTNYYNESTHEGLSHYESGLKPSTPENKTQARHHLEMRTAHEIAAKQYKNSPSLSRAHEAAASAHFTAQMEHEGDRVNPAHARSASTIAAKRSNVAPPSSSHRADATRELKQRGL